MLINIKINGYHIQSMGYSTETFIGVGITISIFKLGEIVDINVQKMRKKYGDIKAREMILDELITFFDENEINGISLTLFYSDTDVVVLGDFILLSQYEKGISKNLSLKKEKKLKQITNGNNKFQNISEEIFGMESKIMAYERESY